MDIVFREYDYLVKTPGKNSTLQLRYATGMTKKMLNRYEQRTSRSLASYNDTKGEGENKRIYFLPVRSLLILTVTLIAKHF